MTDGANNGANNSGIRFLFRALRSRNYRLFFFGQGVSVIGTWMQGTAMGWLIREITGVDALFWLGFIPAVGQLPTAGLPLLTGVLADRHDRRRILLATQSLAMVQAFVLTVMAAMNVLSIWRLILLSMAIGLVNSFDIPARQSFTVDMLEDRADLGNAIALNSSLVNGARVVGPALAGLLIAVLGSLAHGALGTNPQSHVAELRAVSLAAAACFFLNGLSYLAVLWALVRMNVKPKPRAPGPVRVLHNLREGLRYAMGFAPIRIVLMLIALVSFMGVSYGTLMPAVARDVLQVGPKHFGLLLSAVGVGALGGATLLASRKTVHGMKSIIASGACIFGIGLVAFSLCRKGDFWVAIPLLLVTGFGFMTTMSASNTFIQAIVDDDKRGRVMSLWTMSFMGMVPLGSLYTGVMAHSIGIMWTIFIGGMACLLGGLAFATRLPKLRRITHELYLRKGLITQAALAGAQMPAPAAEETVTPPPAG